MPDIGKRTAAFWHSAPGSAQELSRCTPTRRAGRIARFTKSNPELPGGAVSPLVDPGNSTTGTANATCRFRGQMLPGNRPPHFLAFERFQSAWVRHRRPPLPNSASTWKPPQHRTGRSRIRHCRSIRFGGTPLLCSRAASTGFPGDGGLVASHKEVSGPARTKQRKLPGPFSTPPRSNQFSAGSHWPRP